MLEAMALGVPVVSTDVGGIAEVIEDGKNGVLVESGSADMLAQAVMAMLGDAPRLGRLGRDGRARYLAEFTAVHQSERLVALYNRLVKCR